MQLYHKPEEGEIKNPFIVGLAIVQVVKMPSLWEAMPIPLLPSLAPLLKHYTVFLKIL